MNNFYKKPQLVILCDCSSSMEPCFSKLKNSLSNSYRSLCERYDVGVAVFAENFQSVTPISGYDDFAASVFSNLAPAYRSNLANALTCCGDMFDFSSDCEKNILLFSDGCCDKRDAINSVLQLNSVGVKVFSVGFSGKHGIEESFLRELANGCYAPSHELSSFITGFNKKITTASDNSSCSCCNDSVFVNCDDICIDNFTDVFVNLSINNIPCNNSVALTVHLVLNTRILATKQLILSDENSCSSRKIENIKFSLPNSLIGEITNCISARAEITLLPQNNCGC